MREIKEAIFTKVTEMLSVVRGLSEGNFYAILEDAVISEGDFYALINESGDLEEGNDYSLLQDYTKVKVYPKNQVPPKAKRPYIVYDFTMLGRVDKNKRAGLLDMEIVAENATSKQLEAEIVADIFTIEGLGFENDTIITLDNKMALQFNQINRSTPDTSSEKTKPISLTFDMIIDDKRSVLDHLL